VRVLDGTPCGWSRSIVRNLMRPLDLFFLGLPGAVVVMVTPARQRLGDWCGKAFVDRGVEHRVLAEPLRARRVWRRSEPELENSARFCRGAHADPLK